jgi:hypothetical protein
MKKEINPRAVVLAAFILAAGMYRILLGSGGFSPLANFTPLGAMALFGGCYYQDKMKAYVVPMLTLWLSDILLNRYIYFDHWVFFYDGAIWVYGSFALMVLLGSFMKNVSVKRVLLVSVGGALLHWIVSDFGVWLGGGTDITTGLPFTRDVQGYLKCLYVALPFMRNFLIGNILYGTILFGGFELLQRRYPRLQLQSIAV